MTTKHSNIIQDTVLKEYRGKTMKISTFNINDKVFKIEANEKDNEVNINMNGVKFNNLREFTYFINMLTDFDEELLKEEEEK